LAFLKEGTHQAVVIFVAAVAIFGEFEALECKARMWLRGDLRQFDVDAHAAGDRIDGLPPSVLQVRAFRAQSRGWIRTQFEGHPFDLDVFAGGCFLQRKLR
jgi:hypothetical protein